MEPRVISAYVLIALSVIALAYLAVRLLHERHRHRRIMRGQDRLGGHKARASRSQEAAKR